MAEVLDPNWWNQRWARPKGTDVRYHIGSVLKSRSAVGVPWVLIGCGRDMVGPLEACAPDCDERMHCGNCTSVEKRRVEGGRRIRR